MKSVASDATAARSQLPQGADPGAVVVGVATVVVVTPGAGVWPAAFLVTTQLADVICVPSLRNWPWLLHVSEEETEETAVAAVVAPLSRIVAVSNGFCARHRMMTTRHSSMAMK